MNLYNLTCDIEIEDEGNEWTEVITCFPLALCTTVEKAKELAQKFSETPLDWEKCDPLDLDDETYTADAIIDGDDGQFQTPVRITSFWIWSKAELDTILKFDWPLSMNAAYAPKYELE